MRFFPLSVLLMATLLVPVRLAARRRWPDHLRGSTAQLTVSAALRPQQASLPNNQRFWSRTRISTALSMKVSPS
jgi:hypothetical protein